MVNVTVITTQVEAILREVLKRAGLSQTDIEKNTTIKFVGESLILSLPSYARFVDAGRKAGSKRPPITAIEGWIREQGISLPSGRSAKDLAFAISNGIARKGIKARPFIAILKSNTIKLLKEEITKQLVNTITNKNS